VCVGCGAAQPGQRAEDCVLFEAGREGNNNNKTAAKIASFFFSFEKNVCFRKERQRRKMEE
jgi:hypothetical protein